MNRFVLSFWCICFHLLLSSLSFCSFCFTLCMQKYHVTYRMKPIPICMHYETDEYKTIGYQYLSRFDCALCKYKCSHGCAYEYTLQDRLNFNILCVSMVFCKLILRNSKIAICCCVHLLVTVVLSLKSFA